MGNLKYVALALALGLAFCSLLTGQQPARRATSVPDLFNQEAAASDPIGIHKYSEDLIGLIVPPEGRKADFEPLADHLARAEQMTRTGRGKLVAEADVVRAFNELMAKIGAPASLRTDEASVRRFREHATSIKAFPALFSADRNGTNCNPGEAVFLFYLLISNNGVLSEQYLDSSVASMQMNSQSIESSFGVAHMVVLGSNASKLISSFSSHHDRDATIALFNQAASILSF
jgi:hypothetical protein